MGCGVISVAELPSELHCAGGNGFESLRKVEELKNAKEKWEGIGANLPIL